MSGDIQPRKRKGKGKRKDDFDDDVIDTKAHQNNAPHTKNHNKAGSNGEVVSGGGGGSGMVAKAIFLLLLVSLSVVVALILVELRGKQKAAMEENISVSSGVGEEMAPPLPPPPPPAMDEGSAPPEASIPQEAEEEEPEPLGATPPLEEYVKVVREVVVEPLPAEAPVQHETENEEEVSSKEEKLDDTVPVVDEVVEVVEVVTPVEKVVEIVPPAEEAVEPPSHISAAGVDDVPTPPAEEAMIKEPEKMEEKRDATLKEEASEEPASARLVEPLETPIPAQQVEKEEEDKKQTKHMDESHDKAFVEKEQPLIDEEEDEEEEEEEEVESTSAPSKQASVEKDVQEEEVQEEEGKEEEEEEDWSQFGKEGSTGALTDAYLKVESLAEDILALDPQNAMVAQLAPHMAGVLRAMEEGQTEGLLDTLNHIQVILEDVKKRIEENEELAKEPLVEAVEEKQPPDVEEKDAVTGADDDSIIDSKIREELDQADKLLPEGP